jgi:hypothetical protein
MNSVPKYIATTFNVKNSFTRDYTQFAISLQGIKVGLAVLSGKTPYVFVRKVNEKEFLLQTCSDPCFKADENFFTHALEEYKVCSNP